MAEDWTPKDNWSPNNHDHDNVYSKLDHVHEYAAADHKHVIGDITGLSEITSSVVGFPNYGGATSISNGYVATANGWLQCNGTRYGGVTVSVNGIVVMHYGAQFSEENDGAACVVPLSKGDKVTVSVSGSPSYSLRFIPIK